MNTQNLLDSVLSGLQARKGEWPQIAKDADVQYSWLTKLAQGRIPDPGVQKIQRLADVMAASESAA